MGSFYYRQRDFCYPAQEHTLSTDVPKKQTGHAAEKKIALKLQDHPSAGFADIPASIQPPLDSTDPFLHTTTSKHTMSVNMSVQIRALSSALRQPLGVRCVARAMSMDGKGHSKVAEKEEAERGEEALNVIEQEKQHKLKVRPARFYEKGW